MPKDVSSNFTAHKVNRTTFAIREDDAYGEHPLIYVKLHQKSPVLVVGDTGTDEVSRKHRGGKYFRFESTTVLWRKSAQSDSMSPLKRCPREQHIKHDLDIANLSSLLQPYV